VGSDVVGTTRFEGSDKSRGIVARDLLIGQEPPVQAEGAQTTSPLGSSGGASPHPLSLSFFLISLKVFFLTFELLPSGLNLDEGEMPYSFFNPLTSCWLGAMFCLILSPFSLVKTLSPLPSPLL